MPDDDVVVDIVGDRAAQGLDQRDVGGPHDAHCPQEPGAVLLQMNARGRGGESLHWQRGWLSESDPGFLCSFSVAGEGLRNRSLKQITKRRESGKKPQHTGEEGEERKGEKNKNVPKLKTPTRQDENRSLGLHPLKWKWENWRSEPHLSPLLPPQPPPSPPPNAAPTPQGFQPQPKESLKRSPAQRRAHHQLLVAPSKSLNRQSSARKYKDLPPRCSSARTPYLAQAGRSCVRGAPGLHGALGILPLPPTERAAFSIYSSRGPLPPQPRTPMASALAAARPTGQLKSPSAPLRLSGFFRKRQGGRIGHTGHVPSVSNNLILLILPLLNLAVGIRVPVFIGYSFPYFNKSSNCQVDGSSYTLNCLQSFIRLFGIIFMINKCGDLRNQREQRLLHRASFDLESGVEGEVKRAGALHCPGGGTAGRARRGGHGPQPFRTSTARPGWASAPFAMEPCLASGEESIRQPERRVMNQFFPFLDNLILGCEGLRKSTLWYYSYLEKQSTDKVVPPVQVSPLLKLGRYSALFLSVAYRESQALQLPETQAEEERRIAAEEKTKQDELKRIERTGRNPRGWHIKLHNKNSTINVQYSSFLFTSQEKRQTCNTEKE
eukprot:bmy_19414T0